MATIDRLWLATLTKKQDDAGTDAGLLNLTINIDGEDIYDENFHFWETNGLLSGGFGLDPDSDQLGEAQAAISPVSMSEDLPAQLAAPIDTNLLSNSSIRVGIRNHDAWGPERVLLLGQTDRRIIVLAMETGLERWMSANGEEGKLTIPLRLVGAGSSSTLIHRVMLLTHTAEGTDDTIQLQVTAGGNIVLQQLVSDTSQDDFERGGNWHIFNAAVPFTRSDVLANGGITISTLGTDSWSPRMLFVYGLDTPDGRPNEVVHLVSVPVWGFDALSNDPAEGQPSIPLPVI